MEPPVVQESKSLEITNRFQRSNSNSPNTAVEKTTPDSLSKKDLSDIKEIILEKKKIGLEKFSEMERKSANNKCIHTVHRDYDKDPIQFEGRKSLNIPCPFPCVAGSADISRSAKCEHVKTYTSTMENGGTYIGNFKQIAGNSHLTSDIPMQYFSWAEYDFMEPPSEKTSSALVVAMISNCGPQYRLDVLKGLMAAGVKVHSYGKCLNNMEHKGGEGGIKGKLNKIKNYKFTFSFENSNEEDYVTEKLFEPLAAGSVPIYYGAPNAKMFAPSEKSVIWAADYESPEALAKYLLYLGSNDTAYNEYLDWKRVGPTRDFIALVDLSIVHSECRFCIRAADIDRQTVGEVVTGPFIQENEREMKEYEDKVALMLKIRERGTFYLRRIHLETLTVNELYNKIYKKYNDKSKGNIYKVYHIWDNKRQAIDDDSKIKNLIWGDELEIIFENPNNQERGSYTKWWNDKNS